MTSERDPDRARPSAERESEVDEGDRDVVGHALLRQSPGRGREGRTAAEARPPPLAYLSRAPRLPSWSAFVGLRGGRPARPAAGDVALRAVLLRVRCPDPDPSPPRARRPLGGGTGRAPPPSRRVPKQGHRHLLGLSPHPRARENDAAPGFESFDGPCERGLFSFVLIAPAPGA